MKDVLPGLALGAWVAALVETWQYLSYGQTHHLVAAMICLTAAFIFTVQI